MSLPSSGILCQTQLGSHWHHNPSTCTPQTRSSCTPPTFPGLLSAHTQHFCLFLVTTSVLSFPSWKQSNPRGSPGQKNSSGMLWGNAWGWFCKHPLMFYPCKAPWLSEVNDRLGILNQDWIIASLPNKCVRASHVISLTQRVWNTSGIRIPLVLWD